MHRSRTGGLVAALVVVTMVLAACGGGTASSAPAAGGDDGGSDTGETVSLAGGQFSPGTLTISAGTSVTFTDTGGHTVTEGSNGDAVEDPIVDETGGSDIVVTFEEAGTYQITCKVHPNMNMTITVEA